jgi:hypothetical protein
MACSRKFPINRADAGEIETVSIRCSKDELEQFIDTLDLIRFQAAEQLAKN